jgi:hypothetical protein
MNTSEQWGNLAAALAAFNATVTNPVADQLAEVQSQRTGRSYSYPYADLGGISEAVRPALAAVGLSIVQAVLYKDGRLGAATTVLWGKQGEPAEWLSCEPVWVPIPAEASAQDIGGLISYSRRYGYLAALGLAAREPSEGPAARRQGRQAPRDQKDQRRAPAEPAEPAAPAEQFDALARLVASRGKTLDGDVRRMASARGWPTARPLSEMPAATMASISTKLRGLPAIADEQTGELRAADEADQPFGPDEP